MAKKRDTSEKTLPTLHDAVFHKQSCETNPYFLPLPPPLFFGNNSSTSHLSLLHSVSSVTFCSPISMRFREDFDICHSPIA